MSFILLAALNSFAVDLDRVELSWGQTVRVNQTEVACQAGPAVQTERKVFKKFQWISNGSCNSGGDVQNGAAATSLMKPDVLTECFENGFTCSLAFEGVRTRFRVAGTWVDDQPNSFDEMKCFAKVVFHGVRPAQ